MNQKDLYVVFDMDGVLFDSERLIQRYWLAVGARHHLPDIGETFLQCVGTTRAHSRAVFERRYPDFSYTQFQDECRALFFGAIEDTGMPLKPGAEDIPSHLRAQNAAIGLASSTRMELVKCELESVGLLQYFDVLITGDQLERSKPAPDIYLMACEALGADPKQAWAIEDSYNGIRSAAAAGMRALMVPDLLPETEEMERLAEAIVPDLAAAERYILRYR